MHILQCNGFKILSEISGDHLNSLRPSDTIWRRRSRSTPAQAMACCLMAPSHYLNQCWLIISKVLRHSPEGNFTGNAPDISVSLIWLWKWQITITAAFPRGQWVNVTYISLQNRLLDRCQRPAKTASVQPNNCLCWSERPAISFVFWKFPLSKFCLCTHVSKFKTV